MRERGLTLAHLSRCLYYRMTLPSSFAVYSFPVVGPVGVRESQMEVNWLYSTSEFGSHRRLSVGRRIRSQRALAQGAIALVRLRRHSSAKCVPWHLGPAPAPKVAILTLEFERGGCLCAGAK